MNAAALPMDELSPPVRPFEVPAVEGGNDVTVRCASSTRPGQGRRENQDAVLEAPALGLYLVADGVGGAQAGGRASRIAVRSVRDQIATHADEGTRSGVLSRAIVRANEEVFQLLQKEGRVGTTLVALWVAADDLAQSRIAHVGDSRIYRWRDGRLERLTEDHCLRNELISAGLTNAPASVNDTVGRLLTRAVGSEATVEVDVQALDPHPGDRYLLCSDGVLELFDEYDLEKLFALELEVEELVARLVPAEGGPDDTSALVVDV